MTIKYKLKIVVIGDSGIGKTSIVNMLSEKNFSNNVEITVGCDIVYHSIHIGNKEIKLEIWDTAGHECFRSMTKSFYNNACGAIIAYDTTNHISFERVGIWIDELNSMTDAKILLAGTKIDMIYNKQVTTEEATDFANKNGYMFVETSAKNELNIYKCFVDLVTAIVTDIDNGLNLNHPGIKLLESAIVPEQFVIMPEQSVINIKSPKNNKSRFRCC
jgi:small GTP-binding protein